MDIDQNVILPEEDKDPREKNIKSLKFFWNGLMLIFLIISGVKTMQIGNVSGLAATAAILVVLLLDIILWNKMPKDVGFYGVGRAVLICLVIVSFFLNTDFGFGNFGMYSKQIKYVESHEYYVKHFPPKIWEGMELVSIRYRASKGLRALFHTEDSAYLEKMIERSEHEADVTFTLEEYFSGHINATAYMTVWDRVNPPYRSAVDVPVFYIEGDLVDRYIDSKDADACGQVEVIIMKCGYLRNNTYLSAVIADRNTNEIEYVTVKNYISNFSPYPVPHLVVGAR